MTDVLNYDVFAFYNNSNAYIYNYSNINTELNKLKVQQNKIRLELQDIKKELHDIKKEMKDLKLITEFFFEKLELKDCGDNITAKNNNTVEIENANSNIIINNEVLVNLNSKKIDKC